MEKKEDRVEPLAAPIPDTGPVVRYLILAIGWFFVALGLIGVILPVLPTTPFLLVSLWAFARTSPGLHHWLYTHPKAGPYLIAWSRYHVIPPRAKGLAIVLMTSSWLYVTLSVAESWVLPVVLGSAMGAVIGWILSTPNHPPLELTSASDE